MKMIEGNFERGLKRRYIRPTKRFLVRKEKRIVGGGSSDSRRKKGSREGEEEGPGEKEKSEAVRWGSGGEENFLEVGIAERKVQKINPTKR